MRFEHCATFDDKRQFLLEHVERIIYDRYRVTVIGSVPIKTQIGEMQKSKRENLHFVFAEKSTERRYTKSRARNLPRTDD